jgi:hypothetical protein
MPLKRANLPGLGGFSKHLHICFNTGKSACFCQTNQFRNGEIPEPALTVNAGLLLIGLALRRRQ